MVYNTKKKKYVDLWEKLFINQTATIVKILGLTHRKCRVNQIYRFTCSTKEAQVARAMVFALLQESRCHQMNKILKINLSLCQVRILQREFQWKLGKKIFLPIFRRQMICFFFLHWLVKYNRFFSFNCYLVSQYNYSFVHSSNTSVGHLRCWTFHIFIKYYKCKDIFVKRVGRLPK